MRIDFFDDPLQTSKEPKDVRLNKIGLFVHDDRRRVAVGFDLTPFRKRPSIELVVTNSQSKVVGTLSVIEALQPNFSLTVHLRDNESTDLYTVFVTVYYNLDRLNETPETGMPEYRSLTDQEPMAPPPRETLSTERMVVDTHTTTFSLEQPGEQ